MSQAKLLPGEISLSICHRTRVCVCVLVTSNVLDCVFMFFLGNLIFLFLLLLVRFGFWRRFFNSTRGEIVCVYLRIRGV